MNASPTNPTLNRDLPPSHRVPSFLSQRFRQLCLGIMSEVLAPEGLNIADYGAMTMLDAFPGLDQQGLATLVGLDKVSVGQMIERLGRAGWVERKLDPADRRSRRLYLTPEGLALRRRLQPAALAAQDRILEPLEPAEREVLIDLLTRLVDRHQRYARPGNGRKAPRRRTNKTNHNELKEEKHVPQEFTEK